MNGKLTIKDKKIVFLFVNFSFEYTCEIETASPEKTYRKISNQVLNLQKFVKFAEITLWNSVIDWLQITKSKFKNVNCFENVVRLG